MFSAKMLMDTYRFIPGEIRHIGADEYCLFDYGLCIRGKDGLWDLVPNETSVGDVLLHEAMEESKHPSGMRHPVEYKVLIKPDEVEEKSKGGIIIPQTVQAMEKNAMCKGRIEMISDTAFTYFDAGCMTYYAVFAKYPTTPQVGDHVLFGKYAGAVWKGDDEVSYRIVNDKDIIAVIE
jgi:chaperonin GroES